MRRSCCIAAGDIARRWRRIIFRKWVTATWNRWTGVFARGWRKGYRRPRIDAAQQDKQECAVVGIPARRYAWPAAPLARLKMERASGMRKSKVTAKYRLP